MLKEIKPEEKKVFRTNCVGYKNNKIQFCKILKRTDCKDCSFFQLELDEKRINKDIATYIALNS